jgi:hypothetical protein
MAELHKTVMTQKLAEAMEELLSHTTQYATDS